MGSLHEFALLGYLLTDNSMLDYVSSRLSDEHFRDSIARKLFGAMKELRQFDAHTLMDRLPDSKGIELALSHADEIVTESSIPAYCAIVRKDHILAEQQVFIEELRGHIEERRVEHLADLYEKQAGQIRHGITDWNETEEFTLGTAYKEFLSDIDAPQRTDLLPFYLPTINRAIGNGIAPGSLVMLSGTPKDGKSTIALQQTWWLAENNHGTAFISFEQRTRELFEIMAGQRAKVSGMKIRNRTWDETEKKRVVDAGKFLSVCPIYVLGIEKTDPTVCYDQIRVLSENGVKWVTVDHLQLMCDGSGEKGYTYKVKDVTRRLKLLAGQLDVVIFMIAQNQTSTESGAVRTWGSNVPEQDVDAWLVFSRPGKDNPKCFDPDYITLHRNRLPGSTRKVVDTVWSSATNQNNEAAWDGLP